MNAKKTTRKRIRLNNYRVWFKDGTNVVVKAQYPNSVYDLFPIQIRMKIDRVVDAV